MARYFVERYSSHKEMEEALNENALRGWRPVHYATWSTDGTCGHFVIFESD